MAGYRLRSFISWRKWMVIGGFIGILAAVEALLSARTAFDVFQTALLFASFALLFVRIYLGDSAWLGNSDRFKLARSSLKHRRSFRWTVIRHKRMVDASCLIAHAALLIVLSKSFGDPNQYIAVFLLFVGVNFAWLIMQIQANSDVHYLVIDESFGGDAFGDHVLPDELATWKQWDGILRTWALNNLLLLAVAAVTFLCIPSQTSWSDVALVCIFINCITDLFLVRKTYAAAVLMELGLKTADELAEEISFE